MAIDLVAVQEKSFKKGFKYSEDTVWQAELEASFHMKKQKTS